MIWFSKLSSVPWLTRSSDGELHANTYPLYSDTSLSDESIFRNVFSQRIRNFASEIFLKHSNINSLN